MKIVQISLLLIPALTFFACNSHTETQLAINCLLLLGNFITVWMAIRELK
jgi:hypothetical protein